LSSEQPVCYGYRVGEVPLPDVSLLEVKEGTTISRARHVDLTRRPPVQVSLGPIIDGVALPHVDPHDPTTSQAGTRKRAAIKMPKPDKDMLVRLAEHCRKFNRDHLTPLSVETDTTVEHWLTLTNYTRSRQQELQRKWNAVKDARNWESHWTFVKSFIKDETYVEYKHARAINSRTDEFKCLMGPIFKAIEKELFSLPYFIKKIPIRDRPKYIHDMLFKPGAKYMATDYTAFESTFTSEIMTNCEFELYDYMTQFLPDRDKFMFGLDVIRGRNVCQFKSFDVEIEATRMSGEMNTSLGNGYSNLMFLLFLMKENGVSEEDVRAVIEGDDCLCSAPSFPTAEQFRMLGANIKIEMHDDLSTASFCGLVFDEQELFNVTNPLEVLATLPWTSNKYLGSSSNTKKKLLRCKALSMAHQYPGCPIVQSMAKCFLRLTSGIDVTHYVTQNGNISGWERDQLLEMLKFGVKNLTFPEPGFRTRQLVSKLYGIEIHEQRYIEELFDQKEDLGPIFSPFLVQLMPSVWREYYQKYSRVAEPDKDYPVEEFSLINSDRNFQMHTTTRPIKKRV
jgi:hypothetical protein